MYSKKVMEHFMNPRNVGDLEDASGVGEVGNAACGDILKLYIKVDENGIITDAKFKTFGCGAAIASSSIATELIIGKHIEEARTLTNKAIAEALDGLPPQKLHCSVLAADALNKAIDNHLGIVREEDNEIICICNQIPRKVIEEAISHGAFTLEAVAKKTGATTGECGGVVCGEKIKEMLKKYEQV